jgi:hypothetical protein
MSVHMFAAKKLSKEPSAAAVRRAEKRIKKAEPHLPSLGINSAGYPAITHCKFQVWCEVADWGGASHADWSEVNRIMDEEFDKYV